MGWMKYFRCLICFTSNKTVDERAAKKRNKLRKKVGKNQVEPLGPTQLDVKIERIPPSSTKGGQADDHTMDGKWAAPRSESQASCRSGGAAEPSKTSSKSSLVKFALDYVKTKVLPGAIARYNKEQTNKIGAPSTASSVSDVSRAASALDHTSIANAKHKLELEMKIIDLENDAEKVGDGEEKTEDSGNVGGGEAEDGGADVEK